MPIHLWHPQVSYDQIVPLLLGHLAGHGAILRRVANEIDATQRAHRGLSHKRLVVDN
jgi:hypothetical protein